MTGRMHFISEMEAKAAKPGLQFFPTPIKKWRGYIEPGVAPAVGKVGAQCGRNATAAAADLKHLGVRLQAAELDDRL
jgi:hypothetical protein